VKAVVANKKDFETVFDAFHFVKKNNAPVVPWCLTPCYEPEEKFPMLRFQQVVKLNEDFGLPFRVIGQQHKWMFGSEAKQV
jgi:7-carboxy-7-deazaguanine synthase